jgi:hypothetical protein
MQLDCRSVCRCSLGSVAVILAALAAQCAAGLVAAEPNRYDGKYCAGEADTDFLRLIDESFALPRVRQYAKNVWPSCSTLPNKTPTPGGKHDKHLSVP